MLLRVSAIYSWVLEWGHTLRHGVDHRALRVAVLHIDTPGFPLGAHAAPTHDQDPLVVSMGCLQCTSIVPPLGAFNTPPAASVEAGGDFRISVLHHGSIRTHRI